MKKIRVVHLATIINIPQEVQGRPIFAGFLHSATHSAEVHYEEGRPSFVLFAPPGADVEETYKYLCTLCSPPFVTIATGANINGQDIWTTKPSAAITVHAYWRQK